MCVETIKNKFRFRIKLPMMVSMVNLTKWISKLILLNEKKMGEVLNVEK